MQAPKWIPVSERLPEYGQVCDVWVKAHHGSIAHRRAYYVFTPNVGVTDKPAFQEAFCKACGLYEMAFLLEENLITHWFLSPSDPA